MDSTSIDREQFASGISWVLGGIALHVLDVRIGRFDVLFDPVGAVVVLLGLRRILAATPRTAFAPWVIALAALDVVLVTVLEVGVLAGSVVVGAAGFSPTAQTPVAWQVLAAVGQAVTAIGVVLLARHLRAVLVGVASDRWRQVTIAWVAALVALPLTVLSGALELIFLGIAVIAIGGVLLLVALFATRRAAEDDDLDRDFPARPSAQP